MKKTKSYTIEQKTIKRLERAAEHRSKSSIVQEAVSKWLEENEPYPNSKE